MVAYTTTPLKSISYTPVTAKQQGYTPGVAKTTTYTPTVRQIDGDKETVAGQLKGLLYSPLADLARTGAAQTAASRGLLNSSMAAGAGESAAIGASLPIAQADAATFNKQGLSNQQFQNDAGQFNASEGNKLGMFNADSANRAGEFKARTYNESELFNAGEANKAGQFGASEANRASTFNADASNKSASDQFALDADLSKMGTANQYQSGRDTFAAQTELARLNEERRLQAERDEFMLNADLTKLNAESQARSNLQADTLASERASKGIEQANLAFSQYIKGVSDINSSDMSPSAKETAVGNLWNEYTKNSQIGVALSNATIKNGQVVWADEGYQSDSGLINSPPASPATSPNPTGGNAPTPAPSSGSPNTTGGNAPKPSNGSPNTTGGNAPKPAPPASSDYFAYSTVGQMPEYMQTVYTQTYGNINPPDVKAVKDIVDEARKIYPNGGGGSSNSFDKSLTKFNAGGSSDFDRYLTQQLRGAGISINTGKSLYQAAYGKEPPKSSNGKAWYNGD